MWELDYKESWALKNWCFWTVVLKKTLESPLDCKETQPVHSKNGQSWCSLEGLMLKLKFQYFGNLMRRADSFEKTLMLGKTEGRRRGRQRMRWLDGITDSMDMDLDMNMLVFSSFQSLSCVRLFVTPWNETCQLECISSRSLPKLMSIASVMPSNHLILCHRLLLLPSIFPNIRVYSNESILHIRWPKYWSFRLASVLTMNIQDWFPLGWTGWISLKSKGLSRVFFNTTAQKH